MSEYPTCKACQVVAQPELPDEVDQRLGDIEAAMAIFENRPVRYEPVEIARAGTFVSIDGEGALRVAFATASRNARVRWAVSSVTNRSESRRLVSSSSVLSGSEPADTAPTVMTAR